MTFTSLSFIAFICLFVPAYAATHDRVRLWVIFLGSSVFYGWWDWRFLGLIYFSLLFDFNAGKLIAAAPDARRRKLFLILSLLVNLGLLGFFKYFNFFADSVARLAYQLGYPLHVRTLNVILPVGISFYTFQSMSYTIDVYLKVMGPETSFIRYGSYVMFFPQLVAGPIVRADRLVPQFHRDHDLNWDAFFRGLQLVLWGLFLKSVVADSIAPVVDKHFEYPQRFSSLSLLVSVVLYAFQIYGDFSGYSLMAIGVAQFLGYDLGRNFNRPYFSRSFSEFWQRWHISLSSWLRDYLYIPLGGNRKGTLKTYRNLLLTMLLGGLWHGASWNFVIWGGLHGSFLVVQRLCGRPFSQLVVRLRVPELLVSAFLMALTFALTCLTWVFFRAQTLDQALDILRRIVAFEGMGLNTLGLKFETYKALALVAGLVALEAASFRFQPREFLMRRPALMAASGAALVCLIALFGVFNGSSFIYFQF